jgi:hypothetical protein
LGSDLETNTGTVFVSKFIVVIIFLTNLIYAQPAGVLAIP